MHIRPLAVAAALAALSSATLAAAPAYLTVDRSTATLIDATAVQSVWAQHLDEKFTRRLARLNPPAKWAFISQVEGGITEAKTCVVTARVALAPRSGKSVVFTPAKMATVFDALPNAAPGQCQDLAKAKLNEAIKSVTSSLVAP